MPLLLLQIFFRRPLINLLHIEGERSIGADSRMERIGPLNMSGPRLFDVVFPALRQRLDGESHIALPRLPVGDEVHDTVGIARSRHLSKCLFKRKATSNPAFDGRARGRRTQHPHCFFNIGIGDAPYGDGICLLGTTHIRFLKNLLLRHPRLAPFQGAPIIHAQPLAFALEGLRPLSYA